LSALVDAEFVDFTIIFSSDEIKRPIVSESTPFSVDQHVVFSVVLRSVEQFCILYTLNVTRIAASACEEYTYILKSAHYRCNRFDSVN
jgi:hypothetical protein